MNEQDVEEFRAYVRACTDSQVQAVYEKERDAGRTEYAALAKAELEKRGLM